MYVCNSENQISGSEHPDGLVSNVFILAAWRIEFVFFTLLPLIACWKRVQKVYSDNATITKKKQEVYFLNWICFCHLRLMEPTRYAPAHFWRDSQDGKNRWRIFSDKRNRSRSAKCALHEFSDLICWKKDNRCRTAQDYSFSHFCQQPIWEVICGWH